MSHTPWPWTEHEGFIIGRFNSDNEIHDICDPYCAPPDADIICEMDANAQLIAAAPEMLKCLQAIVARIQGVYDNPALIEWGGLHHNSDQDILKHAKKLITKATGEKS